MAHYLFPGQRIHDSIIFTGHGEYPLAVRAGRQAVLRISFRTEDGQERKAASGIRAWIRCFLRNTDGDDITCTYYSLCDGIRVLHGRTLSDYSINNKRYHEGLSYFVSAAASGGRDKRHGIS